MNEMIERAFAVEQVRTMAYQFADLYFAFVAELRTAYGEAAALDITTRVLYRRAAERAAEMRSRADAAGVEKTPDNIGAISDVPFLGWVPELGGDHCPYGAQWRRRIAENPWFAPFAALYCDVTDTTIAEEFTLAYTHKLTDNVVLGAESCERSYTPDPTVAGGRRTYKVKENENA